MKNKRIEFTNSRGIVLSGRIEFPANQHPKSYALFSHCFTCNKNLTAVKNIARTLTQHGFGVLRFDFTGLGQSGGEFSNTDFSSNVKDLEDVASYMEKEFEAPELLIGHSLGGAAAIFASKKILSIKATVTIGAPSSPKHVQHLFKSSVEEIKEKGIATVEIGGRSFPISKQFVDDLSDKNLPEVAKSLRKPILIMHSPQDTVVEIKNAAEIYAAAKHPKSFISLEGADHLLTQKEDSIYVANVIAQWATRYIEFDEKQNLKTSKQVVVQIGNEELTTNILAAGHPLIADEPEKVGGNNYGPSPYDLLLSSLGSCTAMTLRLYADRKKWNLEEVIIHLNHHKDYITDCQNCDDKGSKVDHIEKSIQLIGNLDTAQKERLLEIADRCPVHRSLNNSVIIKSSLQE